MSFESVAGIFAEQISVSVNVTEDRVIFIAENVSGYLLRVDALLENAVTSCVLYYCSSI